jgi:hypothetical protein
LVAIPSPSIRLRHLKVGADDQAIHFTFYPTNTRTSQTRPRMPSTTLRILHGERCGRSFFLGLNIALGLKAEKAVEQNYSAKMKANPSTHTREVGWHDSRFSANPCLARQKAFRQFVCTNPDILSVNDKPDEMNQ